LAEGAIIIDATDHILGRLASIIAKKLLNGERVVVVNAERAMISGKRHMVFREFLSRLEIKSRINPRHTPRHPRRPDTIFKRVVRGMLPRRKPKGVSALRRLRVYVGRPPPYDRTPLVELREAKITKTSAFYTSLGELAERLGWRSVEVKA
jgi:large subunit ribosomal protein L13